ncbi:hypothetical protein [Devosia sediminis]|uniref:Uncharacterized protein n=1 Tax=Devosia sediminis TaxID=2798801 RepID=A0A934MN64_9HYPH|nr:hypothetical protein [Devosia sediminis]MBJ3786451.1 hypothetical protein [Devosia sediminis]
MGALGQMSRRFSGSANTLQNQGTISHDFVMMGGLAVLDHALVITISTGWVQQCGKKRPPMLCGRVYLHAANKNPGRSRGF